MNVNAGVQKSGFTGGVDGEHGGGGGGDVGRGEGGICAEKDRSVSLSSWRDYNDGMKCVCVRIK